MQWFFEDDNTSPVFTAKQHAESKHVTTGVRPLPRRGVAFCLGRGLPVLLERFRARLIMEELPGFIAHSPVYTVEGHENVCFFDGGRGAPQAGCCVETVHALGVEELLVVGLCGAFGEDIEVCDVLLPERLLIEEGTSHHYSAGIRRAQKPLARGAHCGLPFRARLLRQAPRHRHHRRALPPDLL